MGDWKLPWTGACLCGQVKVQVAQAPVFAAACHCRACQKLTGGAYSLSLMLPSEGLTVEGETEIGGLHNPVPEHHFCPSCKTWLFTRSIAGAVRQPEAQPAGRRGVGRSLCRHLDDGASARRSVGSQGRLSGIPAA